LRGKKHSKDIFKPWLVSIRPGGLRRIEQTAAEGEQFEVILRKGENRPRL
jgi:hypothetical protein